MFFAQRLDALQSPFALLDKRKGGLEHGLRVASIVGSNPALFHDILERRQDELHDVIHRPLRPRLAVILSADGQDRAVTMVSGDAASG